MAVPAAPRRPALTEETADRPTRARLLAAATLAVLTAVALVALVWLVVERSGQDLADPDAATPVQQERERVMSLSQQFMLRMGTYGPDLLSDDGTMPEYRDRVTEVITDKFSASFTESAGTAEQLVAQIGVSREAEVFSAGVSSIDEDSATALVAGTFTDTYEVEGERQPQEPVPFRLELSVQKVDGAWLVDDFTPVLGRGEEGDEGAGSGLVPEPSPSQQGGGS